MLLIRNILWCYLEWNCSSFPGSKRWRWSWECRQVLHKLDWLRPGLGTVRRHCPYFWPHLNRVQLNDQLYLVTALTSTYVWRIREAPNVHQSHQYGNSLHSFKGVLLGWPWGVELGTSRSRKSQGFVILLTAWLAIISSLQCLQIIDVFDRCSQQRLHEELDGN